MPTTLATAADGQGKVSGNNGRHGIGMDKLLLTPKEAGQQLGIGRSKLYQLLKSGQLPSVLIGRCRRIPSQALANYIATLESTANA